MSDDEGQPKRSRAAKSLQAIDGDDEFSVSSIKPMPKRPRVELKPKVEEAEVPQDAAPPTPEKNLFLKLFARIFR